MRVEHAGPQRYAQKGGLASVLRNARGTCRVRKVALNEMRTISVLLFFALQLVGRVHHCFN